MCEALGLETEVDPVLDCELTLAPPPVELVRGDDTGADDEDEDDPGAEDDPEAEGGPEAEIAALLL